MDKLKNIKKKIEAQEPVIGTVISLNDCNVSELLGLVGFDFTWIDSEHGPIDKKEIQLHIMAANAANAAAFVRVPWNDPVLVKPILEMGPDGIIFPYIRSAEEAKEAIKACTYPPKGVRGYGPRRAIRYGMIDSAKYIEETESSFWKIIQIEHVDAVNNLEDILAVDGVDAIMVGPMDLSGSVGFIGQLDHKEVKKVMDQIGGKASKFNKPFGVCMGYEPKAIKEWLSRGVNWIAVGCDFGFMVEASKKACEGTKKLMKQK